VLQTLQRKTVNLYYSPNPAKIKAVANFLSGRFARFSVQGEPDRRPKRSNYWLDRNSEAEEV